MSCACGSQNSNIHGPGCIIPGYNQTYGYWGNSGDPSVTVQGNQVAAQVRASLLAKLLTLGKKAYLWSPATLTNYTDTLECSCVKDTSQRSDMPCPNCYGTKLIPGYVRFAHETLYMSSITPGLVLNNVYLDMNIRPFRLRLTDTALSGSITSPAIPYSNPNGFAWDFRADGYNINELNTIEYLFSTNAINWFPLSQISNVNPSGIGFIFFRVSMTRPNLQVRSPEFDIVRARHPKSTTPYIIIARPQNMERPQLVNYGQRVENLNEVFWTTGLNYFDPTIPINTPAELIPELSMYQRLDGLSTDERYITTQLNWNDQFGILTSQSFQMRKPLPTEVYASLVF